MRIPEKICECGYKMQGTTAVEGNFNPKKGDFSVCLNCGKLYVFNVDRTQRESTLAENLILSKHPDAQKIIMIRKLYEIRKKPK